jgi:hypothetical protein
MAEERDSPDLPRGLIDRRGTPIGKGARYIVYCVY